MKEGSFGILASLAVHVFALSILAAASLPAQSRPARIVVVDFSLVEDQSPGGGAGTGIGKEARDKGQPALKGGKERQRTAGRRPDAVNSDAAPLKDRAESRPAAAVTAAADAKSAGDAHRATESFPDGSGSAVSPEGVSGGADEGGATAGGTGQGKAYGGGSGGGQGGLGSGHGDGKSLGEGGRDYGYIRDAVMKNIVYPDEAIRRGLEGKVLLSFVVRENGRTGDIRVIRGSGHRLLDESAKKAVSATHIRRRVPYGIIVHLPVSYKLQGAR